MQPFIFWFGNTSSEHPVLRYLKVCMMQALVVGMGLEWPEGEYECKGDTVLLYGIRIPQDRVYEFVRKVNGECGEDLTLEDLGTVDYPQGPADEIAYVLEREYKLTVQPFTPAEMEE